MDADLALKINKLIHNECDNVPHDIGIKIEKLLNGYYNKMPELPIGLNDESNCDINYKKGWVACWNKFKHYINQYRCYKKIQIDGNESFIVEILKDNIIIGRIIITIPEFSFINGKDGLKIFDVKVVSKLLFDK